MAWTKKTLQPHNPVENNRIVAYDSEMKFQSWKKRKKALTKVKPKPSVQIVYKKKKAKPNLTK